MATLQLKAFRKEQRSYSLSVDKMTAQMPFTLRYVQYMVTSVLQDQQGMFGVRSLLVDEKVSLMKLKDLVNVLTDAAIAAVKSLIRLLLLIHGFI